MHAETRADTGAAALSPAAAPASPSAHLHEHRDGDAEHQHYTVQRSQSVLAWSLLLTLGFAVVEVVTGFMSNSLALISDAACSVLPSARCLPPPVPPMRNRPTPPPQLRKPR